MKGKTFLAALALFGAIWLTVFAAVTPGWQWWASGPGGLLCVVTVILLKSD